MAQHCIKGKRIRRVKHFEMPDKDALKVVK